MELEFMYDNPRSLRSEPRERFMRKFVFDVMMESFPMNPDHRALHTKHRLIQPEGRSISIVSRLEPGEYSVLTTALINGLRHVNGVNDVYAELNKIGISKSPIFSWDELEPEIKRVFVDYYPAPRP